MSNTDTTHDENTGQQVEEFKTGLRAACERQIAKGGDFVRAFISDKYRCDAIPPECRGSEDVTFNFFHATTVLKTLGPDEGIGMLLQLDPDAEEVAAAYKAVAGVPLEQSPCRVAACAVVRRMLALQCQELAETLAKAMRLDVDPAQQHAINTLISECKWCLREVCGMKEQGNGQAKPD